MANVILIKRGKEANISNMELAEGEIALAFNTDKSGARLYAGNGDGKVLLNPDKTADISQAVADANSYTDTKISELVNGAPEAMDTLREVADAISANSSIMTALQEAVDKNVDADKVTTTSSKQFVSSTEKSTWNSKLSGTSTIDGGTF